MVKEIDFEFGDRRFKQGYIKAFEEIEEHIRMLFTINNSINTVLKIRQEVTWLEISNLIAQLKKKGVCL